MVSMSVAPTESVTVTVKDYWSNIMYNIHVKAVLASILTWFTEATGLSTTVFLWYAAFTLIEFMVTTAEKVIYKQWSKNHLSHWVYRVTTQLVLAALVGGLFHMFGETTGATYAGINWVFILCATVDFGSIVESLVKIGAPVPPFMAVLSHTFKRWSAVHLGNMLNDPKARAELEKALGVKHEEEEPEDVVPPDVHGVRG